MKKWLKKHGRQLISLIGMLFVANGIYGLITANAEWKMALHSGCIALWTLIVLLSSGLLKKLFDWWEKE